MASQRRFNPGDLKTLITKGPRKRLIADIVEEDEEFGFPWEKSQPRDSVLGTKQRRMESRRLRKWVKMLENYCKYRSTEKVLWKGAPPGDHTEKHRDEQCP
ncbi:TBC1 domain family member 28-like [Ochotona princeps]|uniref:TBC1 domain family member 28-like n=1 Tax=Ochotona princeps TaxID=9978 RepID=UPI002714A900|nr:TBC1 domain family member 28-like [Ochotona princeps]